MYVEIGKEPIYTTREVVKPFLWGAAGDVLMLWTNHGAQTAYVHSLVVQNGATAGTTTPGAFDVVTPNSTYVVTFANGAMPAGDVAETVFIGAEPVPPGKTFLVKQKTATTAAKDGKLHLLISD